MPILVLKTVSFYPELIVFERKEREREQTGRRKVGKGKEEGGKIRREKKGRERWKEKKRKH